MSAADVLFAAADELNDDASPEEVETSYHHLVANFEMLYGQLVEATRLTRLYQSIDMDERATLQVTIPQPA